MDPECERFLSEVPGILRANHGQEVRADWSLPALSLSLGGTTLAMPTAFFAGSGTREVEFLGRLLQVLLPHSNGYFRAALRDRIAAAQPPTTSLSLLFKAGTADAPQLISQTQA